MILPVKSLFERVRKLFDPQLRNELMIVESRKYCLVELNKLGRGKRSSGLSGQRL